MKTPVKKIIIVGGGSAGWMSAAVLCKRFPHLDIAVIESPSVPIIGVGESTLGSINAFLHMLELKDDDWMEFCNATYKMAIKFRDFYKKDETFYYPFGDKHLEKTINGIHDWYMKKTIHPDTPWQDFSDSFYPAMPLIHKNKINQNADKKIPLFNFQNDVAYHMDAAKFGIFLKEVYCIPRGVVHIYEHIDEFILDNYGYLDCLKLKNGDCLSADLYVDCTGFKSLILEGVMKVPFVSFEDWLPNNRAWTCHIQYNDKETEMENVTCCTAIENGWVWNIPLYHRIGSGYVFSTKFVSEDQALEEYKQYLDSKQMTYYDPNRSKTLEFKLINIKNGIHDQCWKNNVVAVGLSYGFIEPLESTGLLSVQELLILLCETLEIEQINRIHIDHFNYAANIMLEGFKNFVNYHYSFSARRDTDYWKYVTEQIVMDERLYDKKISELRTVVSDYAIRLLKTHDFGHEMGGMPDILVGMHQKPINQFSLDWHRYKYIASDGIIPITFRSETQIFWNQRRSICEKIADESKSHYQYLKENIYKNLQ
jgi:hypothetical protein